MKMLVLEPIFMCVRHIHKCDKLSFAHLKQQTQINSQIYDAFYPTRT